MAKDGLDPETAKLISQAVAAAVGATMVELKKAELETARLQAKDDAAAAIKAAKDGVAARSPCPKCRQPGSACGFRAWKTDDGLEMDNNKEVHENIRVMPTQGIAAKHFQGIRVNNVLYDSRLEPSGLVCCPRAAQIGAMVNAFEVNELEVTQGRMGGAFRDGQGSVKVSAENATPTAAHQNFLSGFR